MLVKELIEKLKELDPNKEIYGLCDDEDITGQNIFALGFAINDVFSHKSKSFRKGHHVEFIPSIEKEDKEFYFIDLKPKI